MRRFPLSALLVLSAATALPAVHAAETSTLSGQGASPAVSLVWFDPSDALPVPAERVAAEVAALFAAWDIDVQWRVGVAGVTASEKPEIKIVLQSERRAGRPEILGEVEPGQDPQAVWVSVAAVARVLGRPYTPGRPLDAGVAGELTTALARVVAHEIAHLAAPDLPHTSHGLMRRALSRTDLLQDAPTLEGRTERGFRARIAAFAAEVAAGRS